jgi:replication factor C small subunit
LSSRREELLVASSGLEAVWVEKYRPHSLDDMVGQESILPALRAYAARHSIPHLLFAGPPGTGKTTAALALAHDLYGAEWRQNFLELNSSNERGIDTVRTTIKDYVRAAPIGGTGFKILLLDEADALTSEAQNSLRRLMERHSAACRFVLSCNYSSRIIEPIQSRCAVFRFRTYKPDQIRLQLERVAAAEKLTVQPAAYDTIVAACAGDLRRATNLLQLAATYSDPVTEAALKEVSTTPLRGEVEAMVGDAVRGDFLGARARLHQILTDRGSSGEDIVRSIHTYLPDIPEALLSAHDKIRMVDYLGEVDFRLAQGANERIQLETLLARFALGKSTAS